MDSFNLSPVRCFKTFLVLQLAMASSAFAQVGEKFFGEAELLAVAKKFQHSTDFRHKHASLFQ